MLKITYTETDIAIEQLTMTAEAVVSQRSILAIRIGQPIVVQPSYGSLLFPAQVSGMMSFLKLAETTPGLAISPCEPGWFEVTLQGFWISEKINSDQGILVVELEDDCLEQQIVHVWQLSLAWTPEAKSLPKAC